MIAKSIALFIAAAIAEIGGAYLVWSPSRTTRASSSGSSEGSAWRSTAWVAAFQPENEFGRVLAA
jgi:small multidrug resistance family-3 protein